MLIPPEQVYACSQNTDCDYEYEKDLGMANAVREHGATLAPQKTSHELQIRINIPTPPAKDQLICTTK